MLSFTDIERLIGDRMGRFDVPCPVCGPGKQSAHSQNAKKLRVWRAEADFGTFKCARCDLEGYARREGTVARNIDTQECRRRQAEAERREAEDKQQRSRRALEVWEEAKDPRVALVADYLAYRGLPPLSACMAETVFRFHPNCRFGNERVPCLIARFAPIENYDDGKPTAIARTRLDRFDGNNRRLSLGPAAGQVVKLSADEDVTLGLGIAESVEKGLALIASGWSPIWATIGTATMRTFSARIGIEALTVFCDRDDPGRDAALACAGRWRDAGAEVRILQPPPPFKDWDDWWKGGAP